MKVYELLQDSSHIYIVTELIKGGELLNRVINTIGFSERKAAYIVYQILQAINFLHS